MVKIRQKIGLLLFGKLFITIFTTSHMDDSRQRIFLKNPIKWTNSQNERYQF